MQQNLIRQTMSSSKLVLSVYTVILLTLFFACKKRAVSQTVINDKLTTNCMSIRPVKGDCYSDTLRDFEFGNMPLEQFLKIVSSKGDYLIFDSAMEFVTNFGYQKEILINNLCYDSLISVDSSPILNLYFNSAYATWAKKKSAVRFLKSYSKIIWGFGAAEVFEFQVEGVAEIEPHFICLIIKKQAEEEKRIGSDYEGFALSSDGLEWQRIGESANFIPLIIKSVRRSKELFIPVYFDGKRFMPIGHFKSSNWVD